MYLSVIIPTYNERENITPMIKSIRKILEKTKISYEIIVVDDNSPDRTWEIVSRLSKVYKNVRLIKRNEKRGLASAILCGVCFSKGKYICVLDADFSHPPKYITKLLKSLNDGADLVIGSRYINGGKIEVWKTYRKILSKTAAWLAFPITKVHDSISGFFIVKKDKVLNLFHRPIGFKLCLDLIVFGNVNKIVEIPIKFSDRKIGRSKLSMNEIFYYIIQLLRLWLYVITKRNTST